MELLLFRLRKVFEKNKDQVLKTNSNFINEINLLLTNDDIFLKETTNPEEADIFLIETGGTEAEFKSFAEKLTKPIVLLSNGLNNSLAASFEIKSYLFLKHQKGFIASGDEEYVADFIKKFSQPIYASKLINNSNLGVIGEPSDWLISSFVDFGKIKQIFNINLIKIGIDELYREINKQIIGNVPHIDELRAKYKQETTLNQSLYIYSALKRLVKKYNLSGLTIRCFDLLGKYKNTACLALALLNEEGIVSACEGDIPSLLTMYFIYALTGKPSFQANPSRLDDDNKTLTLSHCTIPFNMVTKYELPTHFESDLGIAIHGEMVKKEVFIGKIFFDENYNFDNSLALKGEIIDTPNHPCFCRTQITVKMSDFEYMMLFKGAFGNHLIVSYEDILTDFFFLLDFYNNKNVCN